MKAEGERVNFTLRRGILIHDLACCHYNKEDLDKARSCWQESVQIFQEQESWDLVAKFSLCLGEVFQQLEAWEDLESCAERVLCSPFIRLDTPQPPLKRLWVITHILHVKLTCGMWANLLYIRTKILIFQVNSHF